MTFHHLSNTSLADQQPTSSNPSFVPRNAHCPDRSHGQDYAHMLAPHELSKMMAGAIKELTTPPHRDHGAKPALPYTGTMPERPSEFLRPHEGRQPHELEKVASHDFADPPKALGDELFNITHHLGHMPCEPDVLDMWEFDHRRYAQPILNHIHLGPFVMGNDLQYLKQNGISFVLRIQKWKYQRPGPSIKERIVIDSGVKTLVEQILTEEELLSRLPELIDVMNQHLLDVYRSLADFADLEGAFNIPKVMVTCETGNDLSAMLVAAYIMAVYGKTRNDTCNWIQRRRVSSAFNVDVMRALGTWQDILVARAAVRCNVPNPQPPVHPACKRRHVEDEDDVDQDLPDARAAGSYSQWEGSRTYTPFVDSDEVTLS